MSSPLAKKGLGAETLEFIGLIRAMNWSQAEAARRLNITPSAVSQICTGKTKPRPATLNFLRLIVGHENPKALKHHESTQPVLQAPWEKQFVELLRGLRPVDREGLLTGFYQVIKTLQAAAHPQKG